MYMGTLALAHAASREAGGPFPFAAFALHQTPLRQDLTVAKRGHFGRFYENYVQAF